MKTAAGATELAARAVAAVAAVAAMGATEAVASNSHFDPPRRTVAHAGPSVALRARACHPRSTWRPRGEPARLTLGEGCRRDGASHRPAAPRAAAAGRVPVGFGLDQAVFAACPALRPTAVRIRGYGWGRARAQWAARRVAFYLYGRTAERRCAPGGAWAAQDRASYVADSRPARWRGGGSDPAGPNTRVDEPGEHPRDA